MGWLKHAAHERVELVLQDRRRFERLTQQTHLQPSSSLTTLLILVVLPMLGGCAVMQHSPPAAAAAAPSSAQAGATTIVAVASPAPSHPTLPEFLGIGQVAKGIGGLARNVRNSLGSRFPGLEAKPAIKAMTDPANMEEGASPAVKAAAEAKKEEDKADQKVKAIRYLASRGCGTCYPDTEAAIIAALEDCIELVRYETAQGLRRAGTKPCRSCRGTSCCTPKLVEKLQKIAYELDATGCYVETSARVRRMARLILFECGGAVAATAEPSPEEGPSAGEVSPDEASAVPAEEESTSPSAAMVEPPVSNEIPVGVGAGEIPLGANTVPRAESHARRITRLPSLETVGPERPSSRSFIEFDELCPNPMHLSLATPNAPPTHE